jgi:HNH endonuclease
MTTTLPKGTQPLYRALREAGVRGFKATRNVPWINTANDGTVVLNIWHSQIVEGQEPLLAVVYARSRLETGIREKKRVAVVEGLQSRHGRTIRLVVIESRTEDNQRQTGARYDDGAQWLVEDTGKEFRLWRGRRSLSSGRSTVPTPRAYGHLKPSRRTVESDRIERDGLVKLLTLERAKHRCELRGCSEQRDFETIDVHHMTRLGDGGSDHTDNTVALCPPCHLRVHRGTPKVKTAMERKLLAIRRRRSRRS